MVRLILAILLVAAGAAAEARAQAASAPVPADNSGLHVYVLTFGPGDEVWELFGHNAIRIIDDNDPSQTHDVAFNWGTFDPGDTLNFAWHFLQGKMIYSMGAELGQPSIDGYKNKSHRDVRQQELNLSAGQKLQLQRRLWQIERDPSLSNYRYDYYLYNCSSRVRDELDDMIGHRLALRTQHVPSGATFRFHTDRLDANIPWLYVALKGALGHPVDVPIDRWEEMFLPEKLHDRLNEVTVVVDGREVPLVKEDAVLYQSMRPAGLSKPPTWWQWFLAIGVLFGAVLAGLARAAERRRAARWAFTLLSVPWLLLMGVGGALLWWGWLATDHVVARYNENVLHVSVLALPLVVLLPMLAFGKGKRPRLAMRLTIAMAGISFAGLLLKVLPIFYQVNGVIIALCLPVNAALAYAAWSMGSKRLRLGSAGHI